MRLPAWCLHPLERLSSLLEVTWAGNFTSDTFSQCGTVESVNVITDRDTGQSKGFGFVEMSSDGEAQKAIQELNGTNLDGRDIRVNEAKPKAPRDNRGGGGGRW